MGVTFYSKYIYTVLIHAQIKNISQFIIWQVNPPGYAGRGKEDYGKYNAGH